MKDPFCNITEESEHFKFLEHFTVIMYDTTSSLESLKECRRALFCQKGNSIDNIPPTQAALLQHSKRAIYQDGIGQQPTKPQKMTCHLQSFGDGQSPVEPGIPQGLFLNMLQQLVGS